MSTHRHDRGTTVAEANAAPRGLLLLPMELVADILKYLPPTELRRAASLSRALRVAARHAGLYFSRAFRWEVGTPWVSEHTAMTRFVTHAAENDLRVHLDFACTCPSSHAADSEVVSEAKTPLSCFLAAIATAMPCVLSLDLSVPVWCWAELDPALCAPAPSLREFCFRGRLGGTSDRLFEFPVSGDLFSGEAPMLRDVILSLDSTTLPREPTPAFVRVRSLHLFLSRGTAFPPLSIARHFPRLSRLRIGNAPGLRDLDLDLAGSSLRELIIDECDGTIVLDAIGRRFSLHDIPVVRYIGGRTPDLLVPLWDSGETAEGPLCIRARGVGDFGEIFKVLVVRRDDAWRRSFYTWDWDAKSALVSVFRIKHLAANVAYLRADSRFIKSFLRSSASFDALRELQLDVRTLKEGCQRCDECRKPCINSFWDLCHGCFAAEFTQSDLSVACPALEVVRFFALDRTATVLSVEAAHLGHSLGQLARPKEKRTRLVLAGVTFAKPVAKSLLGMAFSSVKRKSFPDPSSSDDDSDYAPGWWEW